MGRRRAGAPTTVPAGRLALANLFIAFGTLVLSAGGLLESVVDEMNGFAISLVAGISIIFIGFLLTNTGEGARSLRLPEPQVWRPRAAQVAAAILLGGRPHRGPVRRRRPSRRGRRRRGQRLPVADQRQSGGGRRRSPAAGRQLSGSPSLGPAARRHGPSAARLRSVGRVTQSWAKLGENIGRAPTRPRSTPPSSTARATTPTSSIPASPRRPGRRVVERHPVHGAALPPTGRRGRRRVRRRRSSGGGGGSRGGGRGAGPRHRRRRPHPPRPPPNLRLRLPHHHLRPGPATPLAPPSCSTHCTSTEP